MLRPSSPSLMLRIRSGSAVRPMSSFVSSQLTVQARSPAPAKIQRMAPWQLDNNATFTSSFFLRKEVIQPHLPIRLPCYDFTPVIRPAFGGSLPLLSTIHFDHRTFRSARSVTYFNPIHQSFALLSCGSCLPGVGSPTSGISDSHGVTGGVYKTRERIHRNILICDY